MEKSLKKRLNNEVEKDFSLLKQEEKNAIYKQKIKEKFKNDILPFLIICSVSALFAIILRISLHIWFYSLFFISSAVIFLVLAVVQLVGICSNNKDTLIKEEIRSNYLSNKTTIFDERLIYAKKREDNWLLANGFNVDKKISLGTFKTIMKYTKFELYLDNKNQKFVFYMGNKTYSDVFHWNDLISYRIYEENNVETEYHHSYGESSYTTAVPICENLILTIKVGGSSIKTLVIVYNYSKVYKSGEIYKLIKRNSESIINILDIMIDTRHNNKGYDREKEALKDELTRLKVKAMTSFVICKFCGSKNDSAKRKCASCGAPLPVLKDKN